ncbi:MAG: hypothetical protein RLZ71_864 [Actinomycetota bacterium]|jgi:energy-coupling factor transport system ATP-binding protein
MLTFDSVSFGYSGSESPVLTRATFSVAPGEFALVCGPTGSGKSTLLKLVNGLAPHFTGGNLSGTIQIADSDVTGAQPHDLAELVGFVNQQPEGSFVADIVAEEIAYSLEQLGFDPSEMEARVSHYAQLVGLEELLDRPLASLSGGQQQRVAIASALAAGQKILVLDEPTSALDAASAGEVIRLLADLARKSGITVLLAEHRLERVLSLVDTVIVVNGDGSVVKSLPGDAFKDYRLVPPSVELGRRLGFEKALLSTSDANLPKNIEFEPLDLANPSGEFALRVENLSVSYGDVTAVSNVSFDVSRGEVVSLMGPNGSGKSSLLWAIAGAGKRSSGSVATPFGEPADLNLHERLCAISLVPQRAADLLFLGSIAEELAESDAFANVASGETAKLFLELTNRTDPKQHPRDISAGQQLALVLALQLVKGAPIVLLDEPTRGLDYEAKRHLAKAIETIRESGRTVLVASHDIEFVAQVASRVVILDAGVISQSGSAADLLGCDGPLPTQVAEATGLPGLLLAEQVIS